MRKQTAQLLHDARGPLNGITMQAELAKLLARRADAPPQLITALDVILNECRRCDAILSAYGAADTQPEQADRDPGASS